MGDVYFFATEEDTLLFARCYLEERNIFMNEKPEDVTQQEIETLVWQIKMCWAVSVF